MKFMDATATTSPPGQAPPPAPPPTLPRTAPKPSVCSKQMSLKTQGRPSGSLLNFGALCQGSAPPSGHPSGILLVSPPIRRPMPIHGIHVFLFVNLCLWIVSNERAPWRSRYVRSGDRKPRGH